MIAQDYPEIGYKRALGVIQLHKAYGSERLNNACQRALDAEACSYVRIKNILKNNMDKAPMFYQDTKQDTPHIPVHANIRGAANYK